MQNHFKSGLLKLLDKEEFTKRLREIHEESGCEDMTTGMEKIINLIDEIKSQVEGQSATAMSEEDLEPPSSADLRKTESYDRMQSRMSEIKKKFSLKQEAFSKKFKYELEGEKPTEEVTICPICHSDNLWRDGVWISCLFWKKLFV